MSKLKIRYFGIGVIFCGLTIFLLFNFVGPGKNDLQSAREMIEKKDLQSSKPMNTLLYKRK